MTSRGTSSARSRTVLVFCKNRTTCRLASGNTQRWITPDTGGRFRKTSPISHQKSGVRPKPNDWRPVMVLLRKQQALLFVLPFLLWFCRANDSIANSGMTEPGVLASGYWIPDGIAVIGEGEFLFADRGGALYHYAGGRATAVRGIPRSRTVDIYGGLLDVSLHPGFRNSRLVYIAYNNNAYDLTVARFELRD